MQATKAVFVLAVKGIRKIFYTTRIVWIGQKIQSNEKWFPLTVKYQPLECKTVYTFSLPSNHLHPHFHPTRERERPLTWTPTQLPTQPSPSLPPQAQSLHHRFSDSRKLFLFSLPFRSINRSPRRRLLQIHPLISLPLDLPTNLVAIKPTHWTMVLYLSLSLNLSLSLPFSRSVLIF